MTFDDLLKSFHEQNVLIALYDVPFLISGKLYAPDAYDDFIVLVGRAEQYPVAFRTEDIRSIAAAAPDETPNPYDGAPTPEEQVVIDHDALLRKWEDEEARKKKGWGAWGK